MSEYDGVIDYVRLPNNRVYKVGSASGGGASDGTIPYVTATLKSGSTTNFAATFDGVEVKQGLMVGVKFGSNVPANGKLDLNGTGDIPIYYKNAAIAASQVTANYTVLLIYDTVAVTTGRWDLVWSYGYNSTYSTVGLGFAYTTCTTAEATAAKATASVSSFALNKFGIVAVKFTYGVPASATLNVSSKGAKPIFYQGAAITAGVIEAGDTATFIYDGTNWNLIAIDKFGASGDFVPFSGGTMTGPLIAANSATSTKAMRNISAGTEEVSTTLSEGDIYIQYI